MSDRAPVPPVSLPLSNELKLLAHLLESAKVLPVITIERVEDAVPLARALVAGGVRLLEITFRTPAAPDAVRRIIAEVPEATVGVGTIITPDDYRRAVSLGARYALSPGSTPELLEAAAAGPIPFIPGIATSSELMQGIAFGFEMFKFFPATSVGGVAALQSIFGPFPQIRFCPTGGIGEDNAADWLALPNVLAVGGSWLTPASDIRSGNWEAISARARQALARIRASTEAKQA